MRKGFFWTVPDVNSGAALHCSLCRTVETTEQTKKRGAGGKQTGRFIVAVLLVLGCWTAVLAILCYVFFFSVFLLLAVSVLPPFSVSVFCPFFFDLLFLSFLSFSVFTSKIWRWRWWCWWRWGRRWFFFFCVFLVLCFCPPSCSFSFSLFCLCFSSLSVSSVLFPSFCPPQFSPRSPLSLFCAPPPCFSTHWQFLYQFPGLARRFCPLSSRKEEVPSWKG